MLVQPPVRQTMALIEPNLQAARREAGRFPFDRRDVHPPELRQKAHQGQQILELGWDRGQTVEDRMEDWLFESGYSAP